jgi:pyruvate/2-oxoacid:ferredoxin oxidoreductase alpha subunit
MSALPPRCSVLLVRVYVCPAMEVPSVVRPWPAFRPEPGFALRPFLVFVALRQIFENAPGRRHRIVQLTADIGPHIGERAPFPLHAPGELIDGARVDGKAAGNRLLDHPNQRIFGKRAFLLGIAAADIAITGNDESPMPVIAARSPSDCFEVAQEAWRIATRMMMPVMVLSDGYIANGSEPWMIPDVNKLPKIEIKHPVASETGEKFLPYKRDELLSRPWALPGTKGLMHRIGGLEKQDITGNVNYDPVNHQHMINTRAKKVENVAQIIPLQEVEGPASGDLLVLSWGGTFGACKTAVELCLSQGLSVAHAHLRWLNPFPRNLEKILRSYKKVLIPELNLGQLRTFIRSKYLIDAQGLNKVKGLPFAVHEVADEIRRQLGLSTNGQPAKESTAAAVAALVGAADDAG